MNEHWLARMPQLKRRHGTWGLTSEVILDEKWRCALNSLLRLTGLLGVFGELATQEELNAVGDVIATSRGVRPDGGAIVHFSPCKRFWEKVDRTAWEKGTPPTEWGEAWQREKQLYVQSLYNIRLRLGEKVMVIVVDDESMMFKKPIEPNATEWNAAIVEKLNFFRDVAEATFPNAEFVRYNQWWTSPFLNGMQRGLGTNTPLYEPHLLAVTEEQIRGARNHASRTDPRTWWLMLNAAQTDGQFVPDMGHDPAITEAIGRLIGNDLVIFKNPILPAANPGVIQHLEAYIRGANAAAAEGAGS